MVIRCSPAASARPPRRRTSLLVVDENDPHSVSGHHHRQRRGPRHLARAAGMRTGSRPGTTLLLMVPSPSTVMVTTSPGASGDRPAVPCRPHSSARQPEPQVPEPRTSPGHTVVPREA